MTIAFLFSMNKNRHHKGANQMINKIDFTDPIFEAYVAATCIDAICTWGPFSGPWQKTISFCGGTMDAGIKASVPDMDAPAAFEIDGKTSVLAKSGKGTGRHYQGRFVIVVDTAHFDVVES
jgi:hypothetical protein